MYIFKTNIRGGSIPLFQNRYRSDTKDSGYLLIPISIRYLGSFFKSVLHFYTSMYVDLILTFFVCVTHNLLNINNFIVKKNNKLMHIYL